jgi:hypothetical protein
VRHILSRIAIPEARRGVPLCCNEVEKTPGGKVGVENGIHGLPSESIDGSTRIGKKSGHANEARIVCDSAMIKMWVDFFALKIGDSLTVRLDNDRPVQLNAQLLASTIEHTRLEYFALAAPNQRSTVIFVN